MNPPPPPLDRCDALIALVTTHLRRRRGTINSISGMTAMHLVLQFWPEGTPRRVQVDYSDQDEYDAAGTPREKSRSGHGRR